MEALNRFIKGIKWFRDLSLFQGDEWTFPTRNVRMSNYDNKGLAITFVRGNTYGTGTGEEFDLPENYVPIGSCTYNGIIYIVSADKENPGKAQIGTYPSPNSWDVPTDRGFDRVYRPLKNYLLTGASDPVDLDTFNFNYSTTNQVDIVVNEIYNGSINLYLADYTNPNIVINTGFNQSGFRTGEYINEEDFDGALNLIPSAGSYIKASLGDVTVGGEMQIGMYHFYFRYVTSNYNSTRFIGKLFPVQVFIGGGAADIEGGFEVDSDGNKTRTDKKIQILFDTSSIAKGYEYLEIATVRYSETADGALLREVLLINKLYPVADLSSGVWILGVEPTIKFTFEEIIGSVSGFPICRSQAIVDSRYYGGNWKNIEYNKDALSEYASLITLDYDLSDVIDDTEKIEDNLSTIYHHKIYATNNNITNQFTGHFRGEIYAYGAKFVMADGSVTEAYPVEGKYMRDLLGAQPTNTKGVFCFPYYNDGYAAYDGANGTSYSLINNRDRAMGIKFDNTAAISYYNSNKSLFQNVKGVIFVRSSRFENLLFQGLGANVLSGIDVHETLDGGTSLCNFMDDSRVPWIGDTSTTKGLQRNFPYCAVGGEWEDDNFTKITLLSSTVHHIDHTRRAVYAPDFLFTDDKPVSENGNIFIEKIIDYSGPSSTITASGSTTLPIVRTYVAEYGNPNGASVTRTITNGAIKSGVINYIKLGVKQGYGGFKSLIDLKTHPSGDIPLFWEHVENATTGDVRQYVGNLGMQTAKYLGITLDSALVDNYTGTLVNVLKTNDAKNMFDGIVSTIKLASTYYFEISNNYELDENTSAVTQYKGDCFLQRVFFRQSRVYQLGFFFSSHLWATEGNENYQYGILMSAIFEMKNNAAMRCEVEHITETAQYNYSYYPKLLDIGTDLGTWVVDPRDEKNGYEALSINIGFNEVSNTDATLGYDALTPSSIQIRPTRIYFSPKAEPGNIRDFFRDIGPTDWKDFPKENQQIMGLLNINDTLVSIQEGAINQHKLGQQKMSQEDNSSDIVLKETDSYLSDQINQIAKFGTQHQWSLLGIQDGAFGVDFRKRIIWGITGDKNKYTGNNSYQAFDISEQAEIPGWIKDYFDRFDQLIDIKSKLGDNPVNGVGINSGYSGRYKEAYFTFHFKREVEMTVINPIEWTDISAENNYEWGDVVSNVDPDTPYIYGAFYFTGESDYVNTPPPIDDTESIYWQRINYNSYKTLKESYQIKKGDLVKVCEGTTGRIYISPIDNPTSEKQLKITHAVNGYGNYMDISCEYEDLSDTIVWDNLNKVFVGNADFKPSMYFPLELNLFSSPEYDEDNDRRNLVFLHDNPDSEIGVFYGKKYSGQLSFIVTGGKAREVQKLFTNYSIDSTSEIFKKIEFYTDYESSEIDPFIPKNANMFYIRPQYLENMWRGPIKSNEVEELYYKRDAELRGTWLKITITYDGTEPTFIRKVITEFIQSFI